MRGKNIAVFLGIVMLLSTLNFAEGEGSDAPSAGLYPMAKKHIEWEPSALPKGEPFYGYEAYPTDMLIYFYPSDPTTFYNIAAPSSSSFLSGGCFVEDEWYACEFYYPPNYPDDYIWKIDTATGNMTIVGNYGIGDSLNGLAYDDSTSTLFGCTSDKLYVVNKTTGAATLVGSFGISGGVMIAIACDSNGNLYGIDLGTDSLYSINKTTGAATLIGSLGIDLNYAQDMAIDKDTDTCYLAALYSAGGSYYGALYIVNLTDASLTFIDYLDGTQPVEVTTLAIPYTLNSPPAPPSIIGPSTGVAGADITFTVNTTDPDGDDIFYMIDWGDGTNTSWLGPYPSGTSVAVSHIWNDAGVYSIMVKAKDVNEAESNWSSPFTVEIYKLVEYNLVYGWNFITLPVENTYTASSLYSVIPNCNIILKWNASSQDFIPYLPGSPNDFPIEDGHGYFIGMNAAGYFNVTGMPVESVAVTLLPGWNALGWFKDEPTTARSILENITSCNTVLVWNSSSQNFIPYMPGSPYNPAIRQGDGFFVAVSQQSQWHGEG